MQSDAVQFNIKQLHEATDRLIVAARQWENPTLVELEFPSHIAVYPNDALPFASTLDYLRGQGHRFTVPGANEYLERIGLLQPVTSQSEKFKHNPNNLVIRYGDESDAQYISTVLMSALTDRVKCEAGVIDALNWCVYEVLDNVFQHSQAASGYVMMQLHAKNRTLVIGVSDLGRGIHRSLIEASDGSRVDVGQLTHAHLAINHALQQGVTSKGRSNQGNGLHGLRRSIEINGGSLTVRSGRGLWSLVEGNVASDTDLSRPVLDAESCHATTVDWRLDCATPVSINDALGRPSMPSELLESIEVGSGHYRIDAAEIEKYVGSRTKGLEVRTRIINYLNAGATQVVIDVSNVGVVSSSFADEVAGKLALELGELEYRRRIFFDGASPTNRDLIERAIELRLASGT
ncbi:ATP-binding protein [Clavibacter michiganensis]|uniref:ATP-binding protein n=1 Tax=Clavibacter michiganensis TaxID=28447 RepID=UPI001BE003A6|nr:ATP-binding protein [Clavibacter michiganensis]MBT1636445.1 DUF4325 domain-containing protein [Clavibacter michiganensis]